MDKKQSLWVLITGLVIGTLAVILVQHGNPANMGFCIACFVRDTAGALGLHRTETVQYVRPEIIGLVLGAFIMTLISKEFKPKGGSSPVLRFVIGFFIMIGALMFLGCPLRMILRIAGGDLNALWGIAGFVAGIFVGVLVLKKGFTLAKPQEQGKLEGATMPIFSIIVLVVLVFLPGLLLFSQKGPGSQHAPIWMALAAGLIVGVLAQRSRLCMVGGFRDLFLIKSPHLFYGIVGIFAAAFIGNLIVGNVNWGFAEQPIAHVDGLWNFLGMALVGFGSVLAGGCPIRQMVLSGSGSSDASVTILGLFAGAAFAHNFGLASSAAGPTFYGQVAVVVGLVTLAAISICNLKKVN